MKGGGAGFKGAVKFLKGGEEKRGPLQTDADQQTCGGGVVVT